MKPRIQLQNTDLPWQSSGTGDNKSKDSAEQKKHEESVACCNSYKESLVIRPRKSWRKSMMSIRFNTTLCEAGGLKQCPVHSNVLQTKKHEEWSFNMSIRCNTTPCEAERLKHFLLNPMCDGIPVCSKKVCGVKGEKPVMLLLAYYLVLHFDEAQ